MRHTRISASVVVLALLAFACSDGATPTTSTTVATTTTTTAITMTTSPSDRVELVPNGPAFILEGTEGPYVEALQEYLVCTGHEQPSTDGGEVTIDGVFGPITADAVAYYQAELRRVPTGEPDEETFASLARDCDLERTIQFEPGLVVKEIAGNAAPGDDDVLVLSGQAGQILAIDQSEGSVGISVVGADGDTVESVSSEGRWEAELPETQDYRISVTADSATSYLLTVTARSSNLVASEFGPMTLQPDGLAVATFGDEPENTIAVVSLVLGEPFVDTGWQEGVAGCTGINRHVTWVVQADPDGQEHPAALELDFSDLGGSPFFAQYAYRSYDLAALDPIARGLTTDEGISLGSDLETFTDVYGEAVFFDAARGLTNFQGDMLAGFEPGDEPSDRLAWYLGAGADGCDDFQ